MICKERIENILILLEKGVAGGRRMEIGSEIEDLKKGRGRCNSFLVEGEYVI